MKEKNCEITITELVRRLNQLPPETHQKGMCIVAEEKEVVTITIPTHYFTASDLSLLEEHCGLYRVKGTE